MHHMMFGSLCLGHCVVTANYCRNQVSLDPKAPSRVISVTGSCERPDGSEAGDGC